MTRSPVASPSSRFSPIVAIAALSLAACSNQPYGRPDSGSYVPPWQPPPDPYDAGVDTGSFDGFNPMMPVDPGPALDIGPIVTQSVAPPPIIGGTLLVTRDGHRAVATDPDRDAIYVIDIDRFTRLAEIDLTAGDEPGRAVEDNTGQVHVVLRRAGAIATLDLATLTVTMQRPVCSTPRGIAFDSSTQLLEVVCANGDWVSLPAAGGAPVRTVFVEEDLRDIVVRANDFVISTFRTSELRVVARDGTVQRRAAPFDEPVPGPFTPDGRPSIDQHEVGWRLIPFHNGQLGLLHQRATTAPISTEPSGYQGMNCFGGVVHPAFTTFPSDLATPTAASTIPLQGVLGVDLAVSADDSRIAVAFPGNRAGTTGVTVFDLAIPDTGPGCGPDRPTPHPLGTSGQPVAVAFLADGRLLVQNREPALLDVLDIGTIGAGSFFGIPLSTTSREDSGHRLFHREAGASIACASCHPEGNDDGHIWTFDTVGARRTQAIRGGILPTAPFHWNGEMASFGTLAHAVLGQRMGGGAFPDQYADLLAQYVDHLPAMPMSLPTDAAAVERGRALFHDPSVACAGCHVPPLFTNNQTVDVGTGGAFQVPSLRGVRWRAPYMHSGCAPTLRDRFGACGGGESHGHTAALSSGQIDDLIAYLRTL